MKKNVILFLGISMQISWILAATSPSQKGTLEVPQRLSSKKQRKKFINFIIINNIHYKTAAAITSLILGGLPLWILYHNSRLKNNTPLPDLSVTSSNTVSEIIPSEEKKPHSYPATPEDHLSPQKKPSKKDPKTITGVISLVKNKSRQRKRAALLLQLDNIRMADIYKEEAQRNAENTSTSGTVIVH